MTDFNQCFLYFINYTCSKYIIKFYMSDQAQQVFQQLCKAVETDQIKLPTLPEVALKIRQAVEKDQHTAADIAALLSQDTALSARLLQLANSPLYRSRTEIDNLQMAVTRLGIRIVKDLVVMLAIKQAFKSTKKDIDKQFRACWQTSIDVAAASRVLAKNLLELDTEQAMLAGLIHNIGILPVIELAEHQPALFSDSKTFENICHELQAPLGKKILSFWNFPQSLIDVVSQSNNYTRQHNENADFVDIVQAAILYTGHAPEDAPEDWNNIPAISKLGLDPANHKLDEDMNNQFDETLTSLINI